ncbi:MAG: hypothetical protein Q9218_004818 [Villophora microphyllina]
MKGYHAVTSEIAVSRGGRFNIRKTKQGDLSERWDATFAKNSNISDLRAAVDNATGHSPCIEGLRSVCWKAFLLFENLDKSTWAKTLSDSRSAYGALRDHFLKDIEHPDDISVADPLTGDDSSPWSVLRQDEELRAEIFQDVERCMPENLYFREPPTQAMLLDILFIYCKLNRDVGYRQGMHEVLAPIVWVVSRDAIDVEKPDDTEKDQSLEPGLRSECLDARFIEHDAFTLFGIIMQTVKSFYEIGSSSQAVPSSTPSNSPIVERSRQIHEVYLRQADPELAEHLTAIEILPQIFLIRWIRLLFGREFPLDQVLTLWDVLFAADPTLDLIDLVCVSMLLRIRRQLLNADYSEALTSLLRYPEPSAAHGPSTFVSDALYMHQNTIRDGAVHIMDKYSVKSSDVDDATARRKSKPGKKVKRTEHSEAHRSFSPGASAVRALQEHGGIEKIMQEAAKGVYSRGEKWGVNKALRGAMEGLQSGNNPPRRQPDGSRWSLDSGSQTPNVSKLTHDIKVLEQRSKGLAVLLENAIEELWLQQRQYAKEKDDDSTNALSLAIAKIQFVQVYLENPTMPFTTENADSQPGAAATQGEANKDNTTPGKAIEAPPNAPEGVSEQRQASTASPMVTDPNPNEAAITENVSSTDYASEIPRPKSRPQPAAFHRPRPSLAQSSFSWMLGEDQRKSSFVSPKPFPVERRAAREKAGFLFGEDGKALADKGRKGKVVEESEDEEVINLGTLKGP